MRRNLLIPLLFLLIAGGATAHAFGPRTVDVARLAGPYRVSVYKGGRPDFERRLEPGSAEEKAVARWLGGHAEGWGPSPVTYVPKRRILGADFDLNFAGNLAVLNYARPGGGRIQVSREIRADEAPAVFDPPR